MAVMKTHHGKIMCKGASRSYCPKSFIDANLCVRDIEPVRSEFGPEVQRRGQLVMTRTEHWRVTKVSCTLGSPAKDSKRTPEASALPCMFFILEPNREQSVPYEIFSGMCLFSIQTYRDGQNWLVKSSDTAHYDKQQCLQTLQPPRQKTLKTWSS